MPRRIYTYSSRMGWDTVNMITSIGSFVFAIGVLIFLVNVVISLKRGALAGRNPWDAATLEWSVPSPPPAYNFAVIPVIASRHPLWEDRLEEDTGTGRSSLTEGYLLTEGRETMGTSPIDAKPMTILKMPDDSYTPFFVGLFVSLLFAGHVASLVEFRRADGYIRLIALITWMWPRKTLVQRVFSTARTSSESAMTDASQFWINPCR